jgi:argininosuccinate synthase
MSPASLLTELNRLGKENGIGRIDLVENRFVGMKSRGVYETPGGTILLAAHRAIESITLDRGAGHLKDELMPRYAELIYNGFWFSPEREMLQALIDRSQEHVEGEVKPEIALLVHPGHVRRRQGRLRPEGCQRFHTSQRASSQNARHARSQVEIAGSAPAIVWRLADRARAD